MDENVYTVPNAIFREVFDFTRGKFFVGADNNRSAWDDFFAQSAGPKKWCKEKRYSSISAKIRVMHATKFIKVNGKRVSCPAVATMTIPLRELREEAAEFTFAVFTTGVCTCLGKNYIVNCIG